ncbi:hypothetical protein [Chitinimonas taiwanensis]|uniref:Uncharacterized protein n=1 Tax=Chitinimonas taiwanensis DSM 18899 TaxID=1121279 RepID=A0A1K2H967_9NEIS|nr:hypothetical protein [Chitinimonas taiwanensis]SFZ73336.1 hypothetical protein SAMN02745887_00775 [Chitinimonas taiwanensis DSM 18899]
MTTPCLTQAIPNEQGQLVLRFGASEYRLFTIAQLSQQAGWAQLAYPQHGKRFSFDAQRLTWPAAGEVEASYLYAHSQPLSTAELEQQTLRLGYQNEAPSAQDARHHVYYVYLAPFSAQPFQLGESIGGGMAERGGSCALNLAQLRVWPDWQAHFALAGCSWAVPLIAAPQAEVASLLKALIEGACLRNGLPEPA